ncbi:hypothetical protein B0T11DRAFT_269034 [Plectosphaerella cucumerina]|uniref:Uncharacterized protein n=1 Tax=Plectosphaerella cucumerina TaxID=40658 RepID=A0A8K0TR06_9PEZI|nr:hypothetical protein B0T11DRAFT_269034 [Plectosphaerella cucumerina]
MLTAQSPRLSLYRKKADVGITARSSTLSPVTISTMHASKPGLSLVFMGLSCLALAQRGSNSTMCGGRIPGVEEGTFYHNASASESFRLHTVNDWRLTLALSDQRRDEYSVTDQSEWMEFPMLNYMLSVPDSFINTTAEDGMIPYVCIYPIAPVNHTSDGAESVGPSVGCSGVLGDECVAALRLTQATNDRRCPGLSEDAKEKCGILLTHLSVDPRSLGNASVRSIIVAGIIAAMSCTTCRCGSPGPF